MVQLLKLVWKGAKIGLGLIGVAGIGFITLAFVSASFPTNGRSQSPPAIHTIQLCAGWAHTDFVIPLELARSDAFRPIGTYVPENLTDSEFVMIGWGDYRFFTEVPGFSDLRPTLALRALAGRHETALRIQIVSERNLPEHCSGLSLDKAGQNALAEHFRSSIADPETALSGSFAGLTYLKSHKSYGVFHTCNDWTSDAFRKAGLPAARWTAPFAFSVTWPINSEQD